MLAGLRTPCVTLSKQRWSTLRKRRSDVNDEALAGADLSRIELIPSRPGKRTPGLTAVDSVHADSRLRLVAKGRGCSITALANSALENWLKGKNA